MKVFYWIRIYSLIHHFLDQVILALILKCSRPRQDATRHHIPSTARPVTPYSWLMQSVVCSETGHELVTQYLPERLIKERNGRNIWIGKNKERWLLFHISEFFVNKVLDLLKPGGNHTRHATSVAIEPGFSTLLHFRLPLCKTAVQYYALGCTKYKYSAMSSLGFISGGYTAKI